MLHGFAQLRQQAQPLRRTRDGAGPESAVPGPLSLRFVQSDVGFAQQLVRVHRSTSSRRDADAARNGDPSALHRKRLGQRLKVKVRELNGVLGRVLRHQQNGELVTAQPGHRHGVTGTAALRGLRVRGGFGRRRTNPRTRVEDGVQPARVRRVVHLQRLILARRGSVRDEATVWTAVRGAPCRRRLCRYTGTDGRPP